MFLDEKVALARIGAHRRSRAPHEPKSFLLTAEAVKALGADGIRVHLGKDEDGNLTFIATPAVPDEAALDGGCIYLGPPNCPPICG